MTDGDTIDSRLRGLASEYTRSAKGPQKKCVITHPSFDKIPKGIQTLIQKIVDEVYRNDFEILRKVFYEKFELYLRLIQESLEKSKCTDAKLLEEISSVRQKIADAVQSVLLSQDDMEWLKKIGFFPIDIFKLSAELDLRGIIQDLRENIDEYRLILGSEKYIVKICKYPYGFQKLKRLRSFYRNYSRHIIGFNGSHLSQIVRNEDWEEKLKYFEDEAKLKKLQDAGFNGYHLSQIVVGAGWEEKLKRVLMPDVLCLLTTPVLSHRELAKLFLKKDWMHKLLLILNASKPS